MAASSKWIWVNNLLSFILLIRFLAILDSLDGGHVSNRQSNANIYIYIYVHLPAKFNERMFLKQSTFYDGEYSTPWWGSNPPSLDYIPSSIDSRHVSDHQRNASQIYFSISGSPNQEIVYENGKKYKLQMSDDSHFEFYDLWENGAF